MANRDEFHARPAAHLAPWRDRPSIVAGRDLQSGGTWLGVSEQRFAAVTNVRGFGPPDSTLWSRGRLVVDLLEEPLDERGGGEEPPLLQFNPFNAVVVDGSRGYLLTNRPVARVLPFPPGVYGVSNGLLDDTWPKTDRLKDQLATWADGAGLPSELFDILRQEQPNAVNTAASSTALPDSIFVKNPVYGTRCSTVVLVDRDGRGHIIERRFAANGKSVGDTEYNFEWKGVSA